MNDLKPFPTRLFWFMLTFGLVFYVVCVIGIIQNLFNEPPEGNFTTTAELDQQEIMSLRHDIQDIREQPTP